MKKEMPDNNYPNWLVSVTKTNKAQLDNLMSFSAFSEKL